MSYLGLATNVNFLHIDYQCPPRIIITLMEVRWTGRPQYASSPNPSSRVATESDTAWSWVQKRTVSILVLTLKNCLRINHKKAASIYCFFEKDGTRSLTLTHWTRDSVFKFMQRNFANCTGNFENPTFPILFVYSLINVKRAVCKSAANERYFFSIKYISHVHCPPIVCYS
jgi:hypothetical protein